MNEHTATLIELVKDIPDFGKRIPDLITDLIEECEGDYDVEFEKEHRKVQAEFLAEDIRRNIGLFERIHFKLGYKYGVRRNILTARLLLFSYLAGITGINHGTEGYCGGKIKTLGDLYMLQISEMGEKIIYKGKDERMIRLYNGIKRRAVRWGAPGIPEHIDFIGREPAVVSHFKGKPVTYKMVLKSVIKYQEKIAERREAQALFVDIRDIIQNTKTVPRIYEPGHRITEEDRDYILKRGPMYDWDANLAAESMQYSVEIIRRVYRNAGNKS